MRIAIEQSDAYVAAREELLAAEVSLMEQRERVAEFRRALPDDTVVEDYVFEGGTRLSDLFTADDRTLVVYQFMIGKAQGAPCPMCTLWADGWAGVAHHLDRRFDFVLLSGGPVAELQAHAAARGWTGLRLVGQGDSTFKRDFGTEDADGNQTPGISVFTKAADGTIRHRYTSHAQLTEEKWRGVDLLSPVWHLLDLTPEGRGDWFPSLAYEPAQAR